MNILITGGAGFIGSHIANALVSKGHRITVIDNLHPQIHGLNPKIDSPLFNSLNSEVNFVHASVLDKNIMEEAIKNQEIILHLAAETGTGQSMYEIERYNNVNVMGTAMLLDLLANVPNNVNKVVVASSRAVYGEGKYYHVEHGAVYPPLRINDDLAKGEFEPKVIGLKGHIYAVATDESSILSPASIYAITKLTQEQLVLVATSSLGISGVALRYQNVYGPGQSLRNPYTGILSIFSTQLLEGNTINIFEDGNSSRDFVYISDVVEATIRVIEDGDIKNEILNVGYGVPVTVLNVAEELALQYNVELKYEITGNYRIGDIRHNFADMEKIRRLINFNPLIDFRSGVRKFAAWVKEQKIESCNYLSSIEEMKAKGLLK